MKTPYAGRITKTAVAAAFVAFVSPALATSVTPVQFTGTPEGQDVVKVCNLPIVAQPNSPAVVDINSPPQNAGTIFHSSTDNGWFAVELRLTQSKPPLVTFFERSHPSSPPPAPYSS